MQVRAVRCDLIEDRLVAARIDQFAGVAGSSFFYMYVDLEAAIHLADPVARGLFGRGIGYNREKQKAQEQKSTHVSSFVCRCVKFRQGLDILSIGRGSAVHLPDFLPLSTIKFHPHEAGESRENYDSFSCT